MKKKIFIAEIGINHNGDISIAKKMIKIAKDAGCDFVKFQKRNPDITTPEAKKKYYEGDSLGTNDIFKLQKKN